MGHTFAIFVYFSKSLEQQIYQELKKEYEKLSAEEHTEIAYSSKSCKELISFAECEPKGLVVFDYCVNIQQQQFIKDFFVRGRHKHISCVYLTQSYTKNDRQLKRNNITLAVIVHISRNFIVTTPPT